MNKRRVVLTGEVVDLGRYEAGHQRVLGLEADGATYLIKPSRLARELESVLFLWIRAEGWVTGERHMGFPVLEVTDYDVVIGNEVGVSELDE
jgi:hypothetical protein